MKKILGIFLASVLLILMVMPAALATGGWYCPQCGTYCTGNFCSNDGTARPNNSGNNGNWYTSSGTWATATQRLSTRSGPSTSYTEPGTFYTGGKDIHIISYAWDASNGVTWVQCEIDEGYGKMRVYTGEKRFSSINYAYLVNENSYRTFQTFLAAPYTVKYGPGNDYATMKGVSLIGGKNITVLTSEYDSYGYEWCQIEFTWKGNWNGTKCRGWVPAGYVK